MTERPSAASHGAELRVLHLEARLNDAEMALQALREAGLDPVAQREDTEAGFKKALKHFAPHIVLSDHSIAGYSGREALAHVLAHYPHIPVVILTGAAGDAQALALLKLGARDYVLKNHMPRLPHVISRVLMENREAAERKGLENRMALFRTVIDHSDDAVEIVDVATMRFVDINDGACRALGYSRDELLTMGVADIDPEFRTHPERFMNELNARGEARFESVHQRKDGTIFPVENTVKLITLDRQYGVSISRDISERKQAEQQLVESRAKYQNLVENAPVLIYSFNVNKGGVYYSSQVAKTLGYSLDELYGDPYLWYKSIHPADIGRITGAIEDFKVGKVFDIEYRIANANGEWLWLYDRAIGRHEEGGDVVIDGVALDITESKKAERQIELLNRMYLAMSRVNRIVHECHAEVDMFDQVCRILVEHGGMKMAWIGKANAEDKRIMPVASHGEGTGYVDQLSLSLDAGHPQGNGPAALALREGRSIVVQDFQADPLTAPFVDLSSPYHWGASASYPLLLRGQPYAVLSLYHGETSPFNSDTIARIADTAAEVGHGLDRLALIEEQHQAEESMRLAAAHYQSSAAGLLIIDDRNRIIDVNPAFTAITGYALEEVLGRHPRILRPARHERSFFREIYRSILEHGRWQGEIWDKRKDGELIAKWMTISTVPKADGGIYRYVVEFFDITDQKRQEELAWSHANYDVLTSLPNRRLLSDRMGQAIIALKRNKGHVAVMALDLDHFKQLNDTMGHSTGDKVLIEVARRLKACVREEDTVARLGGDEFVIIVNKLSPKRKEASAQAERIARKVSNEVSEPYLVGKTEYHTTPSIGVVIFRGWRQSQEQLLSQVDTAMYQAKAQGRNTICFFDKRMQENLKRRSELERALRAALSQDELLLHYQVQVDECGRPLGAEALARWHHPELGHVSPAQFIPLAEEAGLIHLLGSWVLETACFELARWQNDPRMQHLRLAVNVSRRQFLEPAFVTHVSDTLQKYRVNPDKLKLELTESMLLENVDDAIGKIQKLKDRGISVSMDDFGTGYSSLAYLSRLPIDQLKIDQSFVRDITTDPNDATIVQTIISMARSLGVDVIAEGVETEEQRVFLEQCGCRSFQGHLFGKALPLAQFEALLQRFQDQMS